MSNYIKYILISLCCFLVSCKPQINTIAASKNNLGTIALNNPLDLVQLESQEVDDTTFVNLKNYSQDFIYDMKYATSDNFLKAKVYDFAECM